MLLFLIILSFIIYFIWVRIKNKQESQTYYKTQEPPKNVSFNLEFEQSNEKGKYLVFDIETTGLKSYNSEIVQIAWLILDKNLRQVEYDCYIIKQENEVPEDAFAIHGINMKKSIEEGLDKSIVFEKFLAASNNCSYYVSHNIDFDYNFIMYHIPKVKARRTICTMKIGTKYCQIYSPYGGYKWPKLSELLGELYFGTTNISIKDAHDAGVDVRIAAKCFIKMKELDLIKL
jgi:DNA polymerase III epsilon subunit-like protein